MDFLSNEQAEEGLSLVEKVTVLQNMLVARARGNEQSNWEYQQLRGALLADPLISKLVPGFVRTSRDLSQFWAFIKPKFPSYAERDRFIWDQFRPLFDRLEGQSSTPVDDRTKLVLASLDTDQVKELWERAILRRHTDPEGAVTAAKSLLESVCKHILDDLTVAYGENDDLPKLYRITSEQLRLSPTQHEAQVFKQILGGCKTVVEGLGALRNKFGDAHGKGARTVRPASRHAALAVNLAGGMAMFLVETWDAKTEKTT